VNLVALLARLSREIAGSGSVNRTLALPKSANRQRATMQSPQGLDATHDGEMFPVAATRVDSTPTSAGAWPFQLQVRMHAVSLAAHAQCI
jgi:hypothetical protein